MEHESLAGHLFGFMFIAPNIIIGFNIEELSQLRRSSRHGPGTSPTSSQSYLLQTQYNFSQPWLAVINFIFFSVLQSSTGMNTSKSDYIQVYFQNNDLQTNL